MITHKVKTPCIGICSTTSVGDPICRGCKRFAFEVIHWNSYQDEEKNAVMDRIEKLVVQIMTERYRIRSAQQLQQALLSAAVPFDVQRSPYTWLHNLLKKQHRIITDLQDYGVEIRASQRHIPLADMIEQTDEELLILCDAHYARYFAHA